MSDLVGNPEDRFSCDAAYLGIDFGHYRSLPLLLACSSLYTFQSGPEEQIGCTFDI